VTQAQARPTATQTPLIDIHEGPEGLVLEADLPGVAQDGVAIHLEENVLTLTARVEPTLAGEARVLHEEYRPADFQRSFILSDEVDRDRITADLNNGVLRLSLPKAERAKTRRIEIKSS
jgi:HSP20 family molecular chaperone IbpA